MPRRTYATVADYANWLAPDTLPDGAARALADATIVIDEILLTAVYPVAGGMPTEQAHIDAIRDATCAQAHYARTAGDPHATGVSAPVSVTIGSATVNRGSSRSGSAESAGRYSATAVSILRQAGLAGRGPWVW